MLELCTNCTCRYCTVTGEAKFERVFLATMERLLADEAPPGNWGAYVPCTGAHGTLHPRQAYWWGAPMIDAYEHTEDPRFLEAANRSAYWYIEARD